VAGLPVVNAARRQEVICPEWGLVIAAAR